jgi:hypothetical protein
MAISQALLDEIQDTIGNIPSNLTSHSQIDNIYEVYLFTLVLKAAMKEGALLRFRNQNNSTPGILYFRTSPGYIASNRRNYTYVEIMFDSKPTLEAHVSIMISGHSHVLHECDVCVLFRDEANICRRSSDRVAPRSAKVVLNIEAKFYTTPLNLGLGRSFLGLTADTSSQGAFFVSNTHSDSVEKLLSHKKQLWERNIKPGNLTELERLIPSFQNVFKDFKAKN